MKKALRQHEGRDDVQRLLDGTERQGLRRYAGLLTLACIFALLAFAILIGQLIIKLF